MFREIGLTKEKKHVVKKKIFQKSNENLPLEKSISFSRKGQEKKVDILIPESSQYVVWFDNKKYVSRIAYDYDKKKISVATSENGIENAPIEIGLKDDKRLVCFFSQLIECIAYTGFFKKAEQSMAGSVKLAIIWDGHPYFQQQYPGMASEVVSNAILYYDGIKEGQDIRYILKLANDSLTYVVNKSGEFRQLYWVSQGMSVTQRPLP